MKLSFSWMRDYADVRMEPRVLAQRMTLAGIEAESVQVIGEGWEHVIVGHVTAVNPHPNADRLRLATIDIGAETITVVCGAPNVAAGQKIAFARAGANLLDSHTGQRSVLKPAKIRGVESRGMVCSERELGLSNEHEGILVLPADAPVGTPLADYLGDVIFDFAVTPNRPDLLSVLGVTREAAVIANVAVLEPDADYAELGAPIEGLARVEISAPDLCPRYIATVITGVKLAPSPRWMQQRLQAAGMRPINNVVDITNYVMLEYGQPLHAFDYDLLSGHRIVVRRAHTGESLTTIDGGERRLNPEMLVIADAQRPVALAGVMGGAHSEVSARTVNVLLESANFNGSSIRKTSREVALRSEASSRFEKGLSPELALLGARRATQLLVEYAGGTAAQGLLDLYPGKSERKPLHFTVARAERVLGLKLTTTELAETLGRLGLKSHPAGPAALDVTIPYWRMDLAIEDDLVEELLRVKGYDWVPTALTAGRLPAFEPQPMLSLKELLRERLSGAGLTEIITYSLISAAEHAKTLAPSPARAPLKVFHPLSSDLEELRLTLRPGLLRTLAANQRNQERGVRLFELGRVYLPRPEDLPEERELAIAAFSGPRAEPFWQPAAGELDFFDAKGVVEALLAACGLTATFAPLQDALLHPGRSASITVGTTQLGLVGELHPKTREAFDLLPRPVALFELDLDALLPFVSAQLRRHAAFARFPGLTRDLALVVDAALPAQRVTDLLRATPLVREAWLFDLYQGEHVAPGKKSLAFRLVFQAPDRTLTSEEVDKGVERLLQRLQQEFGATLRS